MKQSHGDRPGAAFRGDEWVQQRYVAEVNGATDGKTVVCPRCQQARQFGRACPRCERTGVEAI